VVRLWVRAVQQELDLLNPRAELSLHDRKELTELLAGLEPLLQDTSYTKAERNSCRHSWFVPGERPKSPYISDEGKYADEVAIEAHWPGDVVPHRVGLTCSVWERTGKLSLLPVDAR
jgi:hypothetical protein